MLLHASRQLAAWLTCNVRQKIYQIVHIYAVILFTAALPLASKTSLPKSAATGTGGESAQ